MQVVKESMRFYMVSPLVARETSERVEVGGYVLPKVHISNALLLLLFFFFENPWDRVTLASTSCIPCWSPYVED